ncbi:glycosyltransferase family 2 protein [Azospirillum sp.]|uniref:glycosyltransferase family 2 protein n=1 Tax=Azospirillum sp. TaxID=34012 RepID=UPI002D6681DB|nr:glycosyltransferase family 2 protein [Azospirillum sp.]HYD71393.1 glycosyltransferase family 2 protein [Azospirillum sp.]
MSDALTVTIVTPSFNQAAFLPATLASVAGQSYPWIEHLVRDGGSTDPSAAILAAQPPPPPPRRFHWRSEPDGGQAAAINQAVADSSGAVIGWLNSDDLLTPGAVARVAAHFRAHPDHLMVYGRARWIDADGRPIDWYPTQTPGPVERFRDGCFICQPTVFLRREAFSLVGPLDESLYAAHDFDLWIRLFKAAGDRIGFIDAEQAQSRLHAQTKTLAGWNRSLTEGMRVVHRHFGSVPAHWALTAVTECFDRHPAPRRAGGRAAPFGLLRTALRTLDRDGAAEVKRRVREDRRLAAASPAVAVAISPDGWAGENTPIRLRRQDQRVLVLSGRQAHPHNRPQTLCLVGGGTVLGRLHLPGNGPFTWRIPLPVAADDGALETFELQAATVFIPAEVEHGSTDARRLTALIDKAWLEQP